MAIDSGRRFDVVVFGATGFTGKLVAEYLARGERAKRLRWAIAGRDKKKLENLKAELVRVDPALGDALGILVADSSDRGSLDEMARQTKVVATTVGPYVTYGRELASACAENGTHYADLTGEVPFIRESIDRNHARARETGARIVHSAGFDSIPSDMGVFMLHQHFAAQDQKLARAWFFVEALKGAMSGGTVATMTTIFEGASRDRNMRRLLMNPYALSDGERGPDSDRYKIRFESRIGKWVCPFLMSAINTRNVHRSNALLGYPYGRDFRYSEEMSTGSGPAGFARATAISGGMATFATLAATSVGRRVIKPFQPSPGEGPSADAREAGFFKIRIIGESEARSGETPVRADAEIHGHRDPGYGETALMLAESALCLALDPLESKGGVLTTSAAMGTHLLERLRAAGMTFRVAPR
ncbi:saccharopine dehydrogenase NADP-binding domain-containing protein [Pendulispora brunnea]|uniref:Saccharopine dehydrogenase NADP-binding domain-containing protein n=1 Tax=Pendulispora brunnea TaxID=2905690 RepID=A0ABZ2K3Q3_9BACT